MSESPTPRDQHYGPRPAPSLDRFVYLEQLRLAHDDTGFKLARADSLEAPDPEVDRFVWEAEMLANYGVI